MKATFSKVQESKYLLDADVIRNTPIEILNTKFVQLHCLLTDEVHHEISFHNDKHFALSPFVVKTDLGVTKVIGRILASQPEVCKLVDLNKYEGNGDVINLAYILHSIANARMTIFETQWIMVTNDRGLRAACEHSGIDSIGASDFKSLAVAATTV